MVSDALRVIVIVPADNAFNGHSDKPLSTTLMALMDIICNGMGTEKKEKHWSGIAHLSAEDMLKSAVTEEKKFKNIDFE